MDKKEFNKLINDFENKDLDFKSELPESNKVAQLVCAFYNSRGGNIILGAEDETRKLIGIKEPQKIEHKFVQIIRHWCKLDQEPKIAFLKYKNKSFIIIDCPKGKDTPYFVRGEHIPRVRIGSSNMPANKEEIARLYREGSSKSQDVLPIENAILDDLDLKKIKKFFDESKLTQEVDKRHLFNLMLKERFVIKENNKLIPTIAGILLFGNKTQLDIPHSVIRADRYKDPNMVAWIDKQDISGTLIEVLDKLEQFFLKNMKVAAKVEGFRTKHKTEYPINALREGVTNALVHRDYHKHESILVRMFEDHIDIISPGELLRPLTIHDLEQEEYVPESRNKVITGVLSRLGLMDKRGTGFLRINKAMQKHGLEKVSLKEKQGYFIITFKGPYKYVEVPDEKLKELNERQRRAIEYIKEKGKITNREYRDLTGLSDEGVRKDIIGMLHKKIIIRKGRGRNVYYVLKVGD